MSNDRCGHPAIRRLGIERARVPPLRVYLVRCASCGAVLTTRTLAAARKAPFPLLLEPAGLGTGQVFEV